MVIQLRAGTLVYCLAVTATRIAFAQSPLQGVPAGDQLPRAVPVVIYDGPGVPIAPYLENIGPEPGGSSPASNPPASRPITPNHFPITSTKAHPGVLGAPRQSRVKNGPEFPICVVGDDEQSLRWLQANQPQLAKIGARCLVASVRDAGSLARIQQVAGSIPVAPGSFDAIAVATGIDVWPVLYGTDGRVSQ